MLKAVWLQLQLLRHTCFYCNPGLKNLPSYWQIDNKISFTDQTKFIFFQKVFDKYLFSILKYKADLHP